MGLNGIVPLLLFFVCFISGNCQNQCDFIPVKSNFDPIRAQGTWHVVKFLPLPNYDTRETLLRYSWVVNWNPYTDVLEVLQFGWSPVTGQCIEANATLTPEPRTRYRFRWKTDFDTRVNNAETTVVATDYDNYLILLNCVRNAQGFCEDLITVHSRDKVARYNPEFMRFIDAIVYLGLCRFPREFYVTQVLIRNGIEVPDCSTRRNRWQI